MTTGEVKHKDKQLVVFKLRREEFGIDIYKVREVLKLLPVTPLPQSAEFIEGVINIRGSVIPVIDLRRRFEMQEQECTENTRIIIVENNKDSVGLIVDAVREVLRVPAENIQPPPRGAVGMQADLMEGVARMNDRLIILLKIENLLDTLEKVTLDELRITDESEAKNM